MIMRAFADDSSRDDYYGVAGYISTIDEWDAFCPQWYAALKQRPRLGFYRTADALSLHGQFEGWSATNRNTRLADLARTIPTENICGIATHLSKKDFNDFFSPNFLDAWNDPYYLCAFNLIAYTCRMMSQSPSISKVSKVDFIFDQQGEVGLQFKAVFRYLLGPMSVSAFPFLGEVDHKDKKEFLPLQAADMHAGWVRRSKIDIESWTSADEHLRNIEQREFPVTRQFLEKLAAYQKEHASEIAEFSRTVEAELERREKNAAERTKRLRKIRRGRKTNSDRKPRGT